MDDVKQVISKATTHVRGKIKSQGGKNEIKPKTNPKRRGKERIRVRSIKIEV